MPRFGLIVEGSYDEAVLKEFVLKCHGADCEVEVRVCGDKAQHKQKFRNYLEEFRYRSIDKALVIRDSDGKDAASLRREYEARISGRLYPLPVKIVMIVQELEAWLLADEKAIGSVAGKQVVRLPDPIEGIQSPKERLKSILSTGKAYTAELARRIAEASDIGKIAGRCPAFREFCEAVSDC